MKKSLQFIALILKNGTLLPTGKDFNSDRKNALENLKEFVPESSILNHKSENQNGKKSWFKNVFGQVAFLKASFRNTGGHLTTSNVSYIRIPKSANTSISYAMLVKKYPQLAAKNPDEAQINFLADVNLLSVSEVKPGTFFTVVRNPFARLVSVYRDFFETNHDSFVYSDYLFGILPKKISFEEFVSRVSKIPDSLKDQHLRPQHLFLQPYEAKGIAIQVFKLEEPSELKHFLTSNGMELSHRNKSAEPYDYTSYFTQQSLQLAYSIYKTDVQKLGYQPVYEQLKQSVNR